MALTHSGIDMSGTEGDPVLASYHGKVHSLPNWSGGGQVIILEHDFVSNGEDISKDEEATILF